MLLGRKTTTNKQTINVGGYINVSVVKAKMGPRFLASLKYLEQWIQLAVTKIALISLYFFPASKLNI